MRAHRRYPRQRGQADSAGLLERVVAMATDAGQTDLRVVAEVVGRGVGAACCRLELWPPGSGPHYEWQLGDATTAAQAGRRAAARIQRVPLPIRYGGNPVGLLCLDVDIVGRRSRTRRALVHQLCAVLGPLLHAAGLEREVARQARATRSHAAALGERRRAAVAKQEDERRTLERNLHDGAQHHLVALRIAVGLLEHDLSTGAIEAARGRLEHLAGLLDLTEHGLAATASGALPPALVDSGLIAAFEAELREPIDIRVEADPVVRNRRYPLRVEVAVFFACLEGVNNARKHAPGAAVGIRLDHTYRGLSFAVDDDGPGFDPAALARGSGLRLLADRIAAAGGELVLRTAPGAGTTVEGFMPI